MPYSKEEVDKRRAQRRRKIRKRRIITSLIVLLITALIVGAVLCITVFFPVTEVTASGSKLYTSNKIVKASGVNSEDNLFVLSEKGVTAALQRALPYIDTVKLERTLPGSIHIKVTDAKEYACYKVGEGYYAVSKKGRVLNKYEAPIENIFTVVGCDVECKVGQELIFKDKELKALVDTLSNTLKEYNINVQSIDVADTFNIVLLVDGRFEVVLGNDSYLERKIAHLSGMIKSIAPERSGKINLSMWSPSKTEGSFTENRE